MATRGCEQCGTALPPPATTGGQQRRFCGDRCRARHNREHKHGQAAGVLQRAQTGPGRSWEPSPQSAAVLSTAPPPCACGRPRSWTPYGTAVFCARCGPSSLELRVADTAAAPGDDRRLPAPRDDRLRRYALRQFIGDELLDPIDELLGQPGLSGGARELLKEIRKDADKAPGLAEAAGLRDILHQQLAATAALEPDEEEASPYPDAVEGVVISDEETRQAAVGYLRSKAASRGPQSALLAGGLALPSVSGAAGPRSFRPAQLSAAAGGKPRNPATEWRTRGGQRPDPRPAPSARLRLMPGDPAPVRYHGITAAQQAACAWSVHAQAASAQAQLLIGEALARPGLIHEAIALATGHRPHYPQQPLPAARRGLLATLRRRRALAG
jgi:hypothetical protein